MLQNQQQGGFLGSGFCNALIQGFVPSLCGEQVVKGSFQSGSFRCVGVLFVIQQFVVAVPEAGLATIR